MRLHGKLAAWVVLVAVVFTMAGLAAAQEKRWWPFPVEDRDPRLALPRGV